MWHTLAYGTTTLAQTTPVDVPVITDGVMAIGPSGHPLPPMEMKAVAAWNVCANITRARVVSPSTRQLNGVYLRPLNASATLPTNPPADKLYINPIRVYQLEELAVEAAVSAGNLTAVVALNLAQTLEPAPLGQLFRLRYTGTTTVVANAWSTVSYTMESQLPAGTYAMLAVEHQSTTCVAARVNFFGQFFRPGMPGITALGNRQPEWCYEYTLGVMGRFPQTNLPVLETLCTAADTTQEGYFHVVKMS